ncbi:hypothetical protein LOK49_LG03G01554 [Camellia lanceoleosa]|uniref:Uncharacterized protein n=1 Tax=Camellia lanceoleosa TaxID=1840588 RepID=A0ACC0IHJ2_9ERIC|nr:hypothetical protein LOK49_LG03G01554 [Camellia lanceoleosa]
MESSSSSPPPQTPPTHHHNHRSHHHGRPNSIDNTTSKEGSANPNPDPNNPDTASHQSSQNHSFRLPEPLLQTLEGRGDRTGSRPSDGRRDDQDLRVDMKKAVRTFVRSDIIGGDDQDLIDAFTLLNEFLGFVYDPDFFCLNICVRLVMGFVNPCSSLLTGFSEAFYQTSCVFT